MVSRRQSLGLIAAAACAALTGCWSPTYTYRYRLTLEVDTPDGLKSGSSVIETKIEDRSNAWGPHESRLVSATTRGEAVFVDLGRGRHVIALLAMGSTGGEDPNFAALVGKPLNVQGLEDVKRLQERKGQFVLAADGVPTLATFSDLSDPGTARLVQMDQFEAVFGPGVRFRRAWFEMTRDAVTRQAGNKLPWLHDAASVSRFWRERFMAAAFGLRAQLRPNYS